MNIATVGIAPSVPAASSGVGRDAGFVEQLDRLEALPDVLGNPAQNEDRLVDEARIDTLAEDSSVPPGVLAEQTSGDATRGSNAVSSDTDPLAAALATGFDLSTAGGTDLTESAMTASEGEALPPVSLSATDGEPDPVWSDVGSVAARAIGEPKSVDGTTESQRTKGADIALDAGVTNGQPKPEEQPTSSAPSAVMPVVSHVAEAVDGQDAQSGFTRAASTDTSPDGAPLAANEGSTTAAPESSQLGPVAALSAASLADSVELPVAGRAAQPTGPVVDPEIAEPIVVTRPIGPVQGGVAVEVATVEVATGQVASPQTAGSQAPGHIGTTGAATTPAMISAARVLDMLEVMALQPPPRTLTLDLTDLHGVRVTLALDGGGVNVSVSDSGAGNESAQEWARQLEQLLSERDFGSDARTPNPSPEDQDVSSERSSLTSAAVSTTTTQSTELRL